MTKVNLYCAGGTGTNLGINFMSNLGHTTTGFATLEPYFIDTSRSNLHPVITDDRFYLVESSDPNFEGSGKKRDSNYKAISESMKSMLQDFKPSAFNIVVHSGAGGSGSVAGPVLVSELLKRDIPVIALVVGNTSSLIEVRNTLNTLKSYESISKTRKKPVIVGYLENGQDYTRKEVDQYMQTMIVSLSSLFSGDNRELDSEDLYNFLNFNEVTSYEPHLAAIRFSPEVMKLEKGETLLTLASLANDVENTEGGVPVTYQAVGYIPSEIEDSFQTNLPLHYGIISGFFQPVVARLEAKIEEHNDHVAAQVTKSIVSDEDTTEEGLIL